MHRFDFGLLNVVGAKMDRRALTSRLVARTTHGRRLFCTSVLFVNALTACVSEIPQPAMPGGTTALESNAGGTAPEMTMMSSMALPNEIGTAPSASPPPNMMGGQSPNEPTAPSASPNDMVEMMPGADVKQPLSLRFTSVQPAERDWCGLGTWSIQWSAEGAEHRMVSAEPATNVPQLSLQRRASGQFDIMIAASTRLTLSCRNVSSEASASLELVMRPDLDNELTIDDADEVASAQRRCARALGERQISEDSRVAVHRPSAERICACQGYQRVASFTEKKVGPIRKCWHTPHDNYTSLYNGSDWRDRPARMWGARSM